LRQNKYLIEKLILELKRNFDLFLKRFGFLEELKPKLKSKNKYDKKISQLALKQWLVPTELIREYYGDHVTNLF